VHDVLSMIPPLCRLSPSPFPHRHPLSSSSPTMSAFVAIKTTLSAAMANRSPLFTRTKKVLSRSRRAARSVPTVDVCDAQSSPWCVATRVSFTISL
jgi:hypothetical protein